MRTARFAWAPPALLSILLCWKPGIAETAGLITPTDPRFPVFELSNSAGDRTFASPIGTVVASFLTEDSRYCRTARFPADANMLIACRDENGWQIEATISLTPSEATNPTAAGIGIKRPVNTAALELQQNAYLLNEREIMLAARNNWRGPIDVDELDAGAILKRTRHVYRTSESYVDAGRVQTVYTKSSREWTGETDFKTAYVAPTSFRFESTMGDFGAITVRFVVWRDASGARMWTSTGPDVVEELASLEAGLDAGAGISRDTSGMIPGLIFPGTKLGGDIVRLREPVRLEDTIIDGADCFQIRGLRWPHKGPTIAWIDKQSFLIRRVYEEDELKDATTKTTWFYEPILNAPVDAQLLQVAMPLSP